MKISKILLGAAMFIAAPVVKGTPVRDSASNKS